MTSGTPEPKTIAAASGSAQMLNSATADRLPNVPPPMIEMPATWSARSGAARSARARLVSGPTPTSHVPGCCRQVSTMNVTASVPSSGRVGAGRSAPSSPLAPCTNGAARGSSTSGRVAPACTGVSIPSRWRTTSALWVVRSSGALPATVVMPSRSAWRAATTMAMASSCPGSQSRIIGTFVIAHAHPLGCSGGTCDVRPPTAASTTPQAGLARPSERSEPSRGGDGRRGRGWRGCRPTRPRRGRTSRRARRTAPTPADRRRAGRW